MQLAKIEEQACIGCARCLKVCPVDAIVGAPQFLHAVLTEECIGCGLCLPPCPVDCISMIKSGIENASPEKQLRAERAKSRYLRRKARLLKQSQALLPLPNQDPAYRKKIQAEIWAASARRNSERETLNAK